MTTTTKTLHKTLQLGTQTTYNRKGNEVQGQVTVTIRLEEKPKGLCLRITGEIGLNHGGQCYDSVAIEHYAKGWNKTKVDKLLAVWREWHLNDMNACTLEMKAEGWDKLAPTPINKYSYSLTTEAWELRRSVKARSIKAAQTNAPLTFTEEEQQVVSMPLSLDVYGYTEPEAPKHMTLRTDFTQATVEQKTLGWVSHTEHPDGLLGKQLNGQGYGSAWYFHPLPDDVIKYLHTL